MEPEVVAVRVHDLFPHPCGFPVQQSSGALLDVAQLVSTVETVLGVVEFDLTCELVTHSAHERELNWSP
jgi:hypothetical protein